jgi:short-subunit dehydrogenase involved in D-alanine esterification of teichoic acids
MKLSGNKILVTGGATGNRVRVDKTIYTGR